MPDYKLAAQFIASKVGKTGITVTVDIYRLGTVGAVASDQSATELGGGVYVYTHTDATAGDYFGNFKTADTTVDAQQIGSWAALEVPRIDAAISSRATQADILSDVTPFPGAHIDAAISSRSTLAQADILSDATPFPGAFIDAAISTAVCDGPGAAPYEIIINDPGGNPLDGVNVWISTDLAGANIIFNGFTDTFGKVTPMLDAGNYFAWKQLAGYTFTNPQAFSAP